MAYSSPRSIEGSGVPKKRRKKRKPSAAERGRARRTPTEVGQTTPGAREGERRKARRIERADAGKTMRTAKHRRERTKVITRARKRAARRIRKVEKIISRRPDYKPPTEAKAQTDRDKFFAGLKGETPDTDEAGKDYTLYRDPKTGEVRDFEESAPTGVKIIRAITGDKPGATTPTLGEVANVATTLAASGGASAIKGAARAAAAARTKKAENAATAAKAAAKRAKKAKPKPKVKTKTKAKPRKTKRARDRAKGRAKQAAKKAKARYSKPRRARRSQRRVNLATNPAAVPVISSDPSRGLIEGTAQADPITSLKTTGEVIPATFSFLGSAAGSTYRAAKTGDTGPLKGVARSAKEAGEALAPLFSGDPDKVEKAIEEDVGYAFAPLLPRGAISAPVRAAGRGTKAAAKGAARAARKVAPDRPPPSGAPGRVRSVAQQVKGRGARKRVAKIAAREIEPERRRGVRAAHEIERKARKAKGARSLRNRHGPEAGSAAVVIARYGVGQKNTLARLKDVRRSLDESDVNYVNTRKTIDWIENNPKVLKDKNLWATVREIKKQTDKLATSPRATHLAQGRVAGVRPPEERVPHGARKLTTAKDRAGAFKDLDKRRARVAKLKGDARAAARAGDHARAGDLKVQLRTLEADTRALARSLRRYTRGDRPPSIRQRRKMQDPALVREYVADVRASRHPDLEDPAFLSEGFPGAQPKGGLGGPDIPTTGARAVHIKTGRAEVADLADRSLTAALKGSVIGPRAQRGINRFINRFNDEFGEAVKVKGKKTRLVNAEQWNRLVDQGKVDPRTHAPLPIRHFKQAVKSEGFDLPEFHSDLGAWLASDMRRLDKTPGTKYAIYPREALREFSNQLNPKRSTFEAVSSGIGGASTRIVLFSPAWLAAQLVNEGTQALAAVGLHGMGGAIAQMVRLKRRDPEGYQSLLHYSGDSAPAAQPVPPRVSMDASDYASYGDAVRVARKTPVGRFLHDLGRLRTFANMDRWKSTRLRAIVTLAHANKEMGKFTRGLAGMLDSQAKISKHLKGLSRQERASWLARHPKALQRHLDYTDDVQGNWDAFTRFEREFGPLTAFYPYLRMSLRWTFWTYPKRHPVKAQILYLLAQQSRDELEKVLGEEPDFIEGAMPVVFDEEGEPDAVFPAGQRFGAPGSNALLEAIGRDNVTGLLRALNPALGALVHGVTGTDPFSGDQVARTSLEKGLHTLNQLLSLSPATRAAKLNKLGKDESNASKVFEALDPNRAVRSALNPFIPLSAERARMQTTLSRALDAVSDDPEFGELVAAILSEDKGRLEAAYERVDLADDAREILDRMLPSSPAEERAVEQAGTVLREGSPARQEEERARPHKAKRTTPESSPWARSGDDAESPARSSGGKSPWAR